MRWSWTRTRTEHRQASGGAYTDAIVASIVARAGGTSVGEPTSTAALEIAAGLWARAFASAELSTPIAAVSPSVMASIGRSLVRSGESLWGIDVRRGEIELRPAGSWDIAGRSDPASWQYRLDMFGPSGSETRIYPSESVLHFRYAPEPERPWSSPSPLGYARATGRLAGNLELRLGEESGARTGYLLPVPADGGDGSTEDPLASLKADLGALAGNTALVETVASAWGEGKGAAPQSDWKAQRMGANPPATLAELRGATNLDVLQACGIPAGLVSDRAEGSGQREAWRRFGLTMQSVGRCVAEEMAFKLNVPGLRIHHEALGSADTAGKSRAVGSFVKAGVPLSRALELSGLRG